MVVEFHSFLASDAVTNKGMSGVTNTVTIYGGVWWEFQDVPEPSTFVLVGISAISLLPYAWQRKR